MKGILEIYRYTFAYKWKAFLVILYNLLFVIFNLVSMVLFIPFLKLIFNQGEIVASVPKEPVWEGGLNGTIQYMTNYYNFFMESMVQRDPKEALFFVCVSVMVAFFLKNLFRYGAIWHQSELRMVVVRDVRDKLFGKAMQLPLSYYSDERKGDLMSRMQSDVGEIEIAVVSMLELIYREPIAILISVGALFYWSPQLTLFSFALLPLTAFVISRISKSLKRTAKQGQEQMGTLYSSIDEGLSGIRIIKAFNAQPQILEAFKKVNKRHQELITKAFRKRDLSPPLNETLAVGVMLCIVWFGGSMILDRDSNSLTGEEFIAFILVFSQLLRPIQGISTAIANLNKAKASQDRINEVLHADERIYENEKPVALPDFSKSIRYDNVYFKYKDEFVLKGINLEIAKGKTIALVGESGSGKSTLADLLPRFYDVSSGTIWFDETPVTDCSLTDLRNHIGIVTQESILFNASIRENIAFGMPNATDEEVEHAARIANAHEFIQHLEHAYATNIGERGNKLSGGQKQRISIARAVLKNPPIMILDEATSALDTESEKLVQEALENLMKERTSIIIAHRLSTIRNADEIIVLSKGEIKERGSHDELIAAKGIYNRLCSLQGMEG